MKRVLTRPALAVLVCVLLWVSAQAQAMTFRFAEAGYHPQGAKIAVLEDVPAEQDVSVVLYAPDLRNPKLPLLIGKTVYKFNNPKVFRNKGQQGSPVKTLMLDFTEFQEPGTYELRVEGTEVKAGPVKITEYLYWDTLKPVVKTFYFQRCGQEVEDRHLRLYHAACHLKDADFVQPGTRQSVLRDDIDVVGGWHNGADYAKYATSVALSAARLIAMNEWNPKPYKFFRLDYPLYEPGLGITDDLHHEIKAGLDWLLVMQRRDGAVYRKVAGTQWPGNNVGPHDDEQPRFIYGISTLDTANAAAAWAMAARDFKKVDLGFSVRSLRAAEKAWAYLLSRPTMLVERSETDYSGSGEFIDPKAVNDLPQRVWAAAELYVTTGKPEYHQYFVQHVREVPIQRFSWQNPALQGMVDYLLYAPDKHPQTAVWIKAGILAQADAIVKDFQGGVWPSGLKQYRRSSNQELVERGALLMAAYRISGKTHYREAASRSVNYLLGVNPLGITYITGLEGKSVKQPVHHWMTSSGKLIPGFLVDGPNEYAKHSLIPPGFGPYSYVDSADAVPVNESTLLNNAGLAFLLGTLNDSFNINAQADAPRTPTPLDVKLAPARPSAKPAKR